MKRLLNLFLVLISSLVLFCGCQSNTNANIDKQYLRIHIRANSNLSVDQNIKYLVKDNVVEYLTPYISKCNSFDDVVDMINLHTTQLKDVCDKVLQENNFDYTANIKLCTEYFPTRAYGDYVLNADVYDAIIVELGSAKGDNWWCVVYPPLCFVENKNLNSNTIRYKSKLIELINKFFD